VTTAPYVSEKSSALTLSSLEKLASPSRRRANLFWASILCGRSIFGASARTASWPGAFRGYGWRQRAEVGHGAPEGA